MNLNFTYQSKKDNKYFFFDEKFNSVIIEIKTPLNLKRGDKIEIKKI